MSYLCNNCGERFEEPKVAYERHGLDYPPFEKIFVCPYCGINDYDEDEEEDEDG